MACMLYFARCMNIIFNELRKPYTPFLSHIIFIANFNWNYFVMHRNTIRRAWVGLLGHDWSILIGCD